MRGPKISVIIPIYNVEAYLEKCLSSVTGQTYTDLEIICVDDGSTDSSGSIVDRFAAKDSRIVAIHKRNGGLVSARKAGVAVATGDYVLPVDGDDWIEKDRVEVLVRDGIIPTQADMIHLSGYISDTGKKSMRYSFDVPIKLFENDEIENEVFPLMSRESGEAFNMTIKGMLVTWAIRRELLLKNQMLVDDCVAVGEDYLCVCLCLLEAKSVMTIQQGGYHYIQRASSIIYKAAIATDKNSLQMRIWYQIMKNQLEQKRASEITRRICSHFAIYSIMNSNYDSLLEKFPDYLFPFPKVSSGARIVVYGAGRIGYSLVQNLDKTKKCSVVLWVDQNQNRPTVPGYTVSSREAISSAVYDYIVIAIMNANVAKEVKRTLILDGIPEEKIATMDASVISEDAIPDEIRNF